MKTTHDHGNVRNRAMDPFFSRYPGIATPLRSCCWNVEPSALNADHDNLLIMQYVLRSPMKQECLYAKLDGGSLHFEWI